MTRHHEDWSRPKVVEWVATGDPRVQSVVECLHSNRLQDALSQVLVLVNRRSRLRAQVSDPNLSLLHVELILRLDDLVDVLVRRWHAVHLDLL